MANEKKFNFVSPGIRVNEIDNSGRPNVAKNIGPVIIGRAERGPHIPTTVNSMAEFIETYGNPIPGGAGGDIWRDGNKVAPAYGTYAMQGWLRSNSPATFIRLLGHEHQDSTSDGRAGWEVQDLGTSATNGGAYGLFIVDSGSSPSDVQTGSLAAIFYIQSGSIQLKGNIAGTSALTASVGTMIGSTGADKEFKIIIRNGSLETVKETTFNFNESSKKFIRKVFNTNPTLVNTDVTPSDVTSNYWLGETFEKFVNEKVTNSGAGENFGILVGLKDPTSDSEQASFRFGCRPGQSGWVIAQDLNTVGGSSNNFDASTMTKLFKIHGLHSGEWLQKNVKISISEITPSINENEPYGTFTVTLRDIADSDNAIQIIERYKNCSLNPNSPNYIAKKIGDKHLVWNDRERKYYEYGSYNNQSKFIRVEMNSIVDNGGIPAEMLPFGFHGPIRHKGFAIAEGNVRVFDDYDTDYEEAFAAGEGTIYDIHHSAVGDGFYAGDDELTASFQFPTLTLRGDTYSGSLSDPRQAYFGIEVGKSSASTIFQRGFSDYVRPLCYGFDSFAEESETETSFVFTLDDISGSSNNHAFYVSGSRASGTSLTANGTYKDVLDADYGKFTLPFFGGFDGLNTLEQDPFRNSLLVGANDLNSYSYNTIKRAIDSVKDPEEFDLNLISMPGLTESSLNQHMIFIAEDRSDCMAIIDLEGSYVPPSENTSDEVNRLGSVSAVISEMEISGYNSSYAAAYFDWIRIKDTISGNDLWVPPSVAAIGTISYTQKTKDLWYAPAGTSRSLTNGAAGVPVIGIRQRLRTKDRDKLYLSRINPITDYKGNIVIWGQKTMNLPRSNRANSALSRIDVRLLVNHIKKRISQISMDFIFEKNIFQTWLKWKGQVSPFLEDIKARYGLERFNIILDSSTTTDELVDRNVMYAVVSIVPAKSIEAIEVDLQVNNSGASFAE